MEEILVSINCITYNHERYIADAIESFLMQKTKFKYEILIHDDASTDQTVNIIRKYEKEYPDIVKPIYQTENQYSKGRSVFLLNQERALGKYTAICEGDDYWIDTNKLQRQVDYMEENSKCSMCFHAALFVDVNKNPIGDIAKLYDHDGLVSMKDIIRKSNPRNIPTASRLCRSEFLKDFPKWYSECSIGDMPMSLLLGARGEFFYINEIMSAYRIGVPGSWTSRTLEGKNKIPGRIKILKEGSHILELFNQSTDYKYDGEIKQATEENEIDILVLERNFKEIKNGKGRDYYQSINITSKIKLITNCYFPNIYFLIAKIKNHIRKDRG